MVKAKRVTKSSNYFIIIASILLLIASLAVAYVYGRNHSSNDSTALRSALMASAANVNSPVPLDARSGDVYFADMKLTIPKSTAVSDLTYNYNRDEIDGKNIDVLALGNKQVFSENVSYMNETQGYEDVFNTFSEVQDCLSAVLITSDIYSQDDKFDLYEKKTLADGRVIYIYTNSKCETSQRTLDQVKNIQSY
jgi:uncharacterized protein (UPF0333 family)